MSMQEIIQQLRHVHVDCEVMFTYWRCRCSP